jgi:hypothetical protein
MSKSAHNEAQIIAAVKHVEAGRKADEWLARWGGRVVHTREEPQYFIKSKD